MATHLGIQSLSRSQVSEKTKGLNKQLHTSHNRSLADPRYPVLWVDTLYQKVHANRRIINMAVLLVCGVDEQGRSDILAVEPMPEESEGSYLLLFRTLQERDLTIPRLVISDTHAGLTSTIRKG